MDTHSYLIIYCIEHEKMKFIPLFVIHDFQFQWDFWKSTSRCFSSYKNVVTELKMTLLTLSERVYCSKEKSSIKEINYKISY